MKVCIVQNNVLGTKLETFERIKSILPNSILSNTNILVLPECFCIPYELKEFKNNSEELKEGNLIFNFLKNLSLKYPELYVVGGTLIEKVEDKYYNTCPVFYNGELIDKYSKINLFDIDFNSSTGRIKYSESEILSRGRTPTIIDTKFGKIGLGICFDLRFNELANYYSKNNVSLIIYPGCFTIPTGALHWELLLRARALDSRCFTIGCSTSRDINANYIAYGNSMVVDPYGKVLKKLEEKEDYFLVNLDNSVCEKIKESIPCHFEKY